MADRRQSTFAHLVNVRADRTETADATFLVHDDRRWTYVDYREECRRTGRFLMGRLRDAPHGTPPHVCMLLENHLEFVSLLGGCALGGLTLFALGTGMTPEILHGLIAKAEAGILVVEDRYYASVEPILASLPRLRRENVLVFSPRGEWADPSVDLILRMHAEVGSPGSSQPFTDVRADPEFPLMVTYTSGTTGLPKGVLHPHEKLVRQGFGVSRLTALSGSETTYNSIPLFHSSGIAVGLMPAMVSGGTFAIREKFGARRFLDDIKMYGATIWVYVGVTIHYVLEAIEAEYGDPEGIVREVAENPNNRLRWALGNGASPRDIDRFTQYLGVEHVYEFYGSSEAAIFVMRDRQTPRGSVGPVSPEVRILDEQGRECPPVTAAESGETINSTSSVGEICRVHDDLHLFRGYYRDPEATERKLEGGVFHSGDLGHIRLYEGRRYLYFDGRTDDWIRKDGENFSAELVARELSHHPDVRLCVCYGVPCAVADELVMAALELHEGVRFDPQNFFDWCAHRVEGGSMDAKWFPDFIRIVSSFDQTATAKIRAQNLKRVHFDMSRLCAAELPIYFRERDDASFRQFSVDDYARLRDRFVLNQRIDVLDPS